MRLFTRPEPLYERCPVFLMNGEEIVDVFDMPTRGDLQGTTRNWVPAARTEFVATGEFDRVVWEGPAGCFEMRIPGVAGSQIMICGPGGGGVPFEQCNRLAAPKQWIEDDSGVILQSERPRL